jgi:hypothetical protein
LPYFSGHETHLVLVFFCQSKFSGKKLKIQKSTPPTEHIWNAALYCSTTGTQCCKRTGTRAKSCKSCELSEFKIVVVGFFPSSDKKFFDPISWGILSQCIWFILLFPIPVLCNGLPIIPSHAVSFHPMLWVRIPCSRFLSHTVGSHVMLWIPIPCYGFMFHAVDSYPILWAPIPCCRFLSHTVGSHAMLWIPCSGFLSHALGSYPMLWIPIPCYGFLFHAADSFPILWVPMPCCGFLSHAMGSYPML